MFSRLYAAGNTPTRECEGNLYRVFCAYVLLGVHIVLVIAFFISIICVVDQTIVNNGERFSDGKTPWLVSDVTTFISAGLVAVRLVTSCWTTMAVWRCAFILMEHGGLNLKQLNDMISYGLPRVWKGRMSLFVGVVLLLMLPLKIVAPLLSGSVNWSTAETWVNGGLVSDLDPNADHGNWGWYKMWATTRKQYARQAVGLASTSWTNILDADGGACHHVVNDMRLSINSTLLNATLPYIKIHNISWDDQPVTTKVAELIQKSAEGTDSSNISIIQDPQFSYYHNGNAVLFDPYMMRNDSDSFNATIPTPSIFSGLKTVVVALNRQTANNCSSIAPNIFGNATTMAQIKYAFSVRTDGLERCFVIGKVNLTAGVITSPKSKFVSSRVVSHEADGAVRPDPWVTEALFLVPDVMTQVSLQNTSMIPTWDNLSNYTEKLIRYSYLAAWDTLHMNFDPSPPMNWTAEQAIIMLQASVSRWRVYLWLAINALMTCSGIVLLAIQIQSSRAPAIDIPAVAITTVPYLEADPNLKAVPGLETDQHLKDLERFSNMSYVTKDDSKVKLRWPSGHDGAQETEEGIPLV